MGLSIEVRGHAFVSRTGRRVGKPAVRHRRDVAARRNPQMDLVDPVYVWRSR
jgi:hypothetical protein